MQTLPFQPEIAERMLAGTTDEHIHPEAVFVRTANGYWVAWHQGVAAVLADTTPPDIPCDWVEGAESLAELVAMLESGEYAEIAEFDGDDEAWAQMLAGCDEDHEHNEHCGHNHK